jgi:putative nucleotidyltransferase with HDIG domain
MKESILALFPRLRDITDADLLGTVVEIWIETIHRSVFAVDDLTSRRIPFTLLVPGLVSGQSANTTFVEHTNEVTEAALLLAESLNRCGADLPRDHVIAAANLHDVGKLLEYEIVGGNIVQNEEGKKLRHPFLGAAVAFGRGLPVDVIQAIFGHSKELADEKRSLLCKVINRADFFFFHPIKDFLQTE